VSISRRPVRPRTPFVLACASLLVILVASPSLARFGLADAVVSDAAASPAHLVISELMTGGASASDEFVELYNPTVGELPVEGLELVYVTASGATVTRKVTWAVGAPGVPAWSHLLIANAAGAYAAIADLTYSNGLSASGGSLALRDQGTETAVDAVGWGTATAWLEGSPAPAPAAGTSLERLPGGALGSTQDTDDNLADFVVSPTPDPQGAAAPPVVPPGESASPSPSSSPTPVPTPTPAPTPTPTPSSTSSLTPTASPTATPTPIPTATPTVSPTPSPMPTPTPTPETLSILQARNLADGSAARINGIALMGSDLADGGGCVTDGTAGIAVLPDGASFAQGDLVTADGTVDDRYAQRTLRVDASGLQILGDGTQPVPAETTTGAVGEAVECRLVQLAGTVLGAPAELTSGLAYDVDDGTGAIRVLVAGAAGIDTATWTPGSRIALVGVVGQRDSSGSGTGGYRVQPRGAEDVLSVEPPASPSPSPAPSSSPSPGASASPAPDLVGIAVARAAETGTHVRVRGVVTLQNALVDDPTAVIQDASGAIVLRLGDNAGRVSLGMLVEVVGIRSTKLGMETIRTDVQPVVLGDAAEPEPLDVATGALGEDAEATLVRVRGTVTSAPVRSTAGNLAFAVDDGSGELRVTLFASAAITGAVIERGARLEIVGVLGQVTTGAKPDRGYRLWPRGPADIVLISAAPTGQVSGEASSPGATRSAAGGASPSTTADATTADVPLPVLTLEAGPAAVVSGSREVLDGESTGLAASALSDIGSGSVQRPAFALLLLAAALALVLAAAAWRTGALGRGWEALVATPAEDRVPEG
jgi:Lamin Tail Domain